MSGRVNKPWPVPVQVGAGRQAAGGRAPGGGVGARGVAGRGRLVDAEAAAAPLLRAGAGGRQRCRRLLRAGRGRWYPAAGLMLTATSSSTATRPTRSWTAPPIRPSWRPRRPTLGHEALALTDHDNVCGAMEFAHACKGVGVRPIVGCELTVEVPRRLSRPVHVTLLGREREGWPNLCRLITAAHRGTREGTADADERPRRPRSRSTSSSGTPRGWSASRAARATAQSRGPGSAGDPAERGPSGRAAAAGLRPRPLPGRAAAAALAARPRAEPLARLAGGAARRAGVATGNAHAHDRSRLPLQDALVAVRLGATLDETEGLRRGNSASALLSSAEAAAGALPRPPGGGGRDGAAGRAAALRPHPRPRLQLSGRGGPRRGPAAGRALPGRGWSIATRGPPSAPRPSGGWRRSWR